jgi:inorganic pyrophosphatase
MNIEVQIEVPRGSNVKYEYDHINHKLIVDRILHSPVYYFFNYGYIPDTLGGDGDPLDVVVLTNETLYPTAYVECKIIGVLKTEDEKGEDDKIICVPRDKIDFVSKGINDLADIDEMTKDRLVQFFETYKKLEPNKWVRTKGFGDKEAALSILAEAKNAHVA